MELLLPSIGDRVITTKDIQNKFGSILKDTECIVIGVTSKGYNLQDDLGKRLVECGFDCCKVLKRL